MIIIDCGAYWEMAKHLKNVTLITTLFNESPNIISFLESYRNQTAYANEFIIVDGGSNDGTCQIINDFSKEYPDLMIKLIIDKSCSRSFTKGPIARGRNVAIENSKNSIIAVTDAGCLLEEMWLEEIVRPFGDSDVDVVSGWYQAKVSNEFQKLYATEFMPILESINIMSFLPSSRSIAFRKDCWVRVGGYPTSTYTAEDTKFDLNLLKAGYKFTFAEKAIVFWECPGSLAEAKKKHYNYAFGDGQYGIFKQHYLKQLIHLLVPVKCFIKKETNAVKLFELFNVKYQLTFYTCIGYIKGLISGIEDNN